MAVWIVRSIIQASASLAAGQDAACVKQGVLGWA
jgi:hypothetical protein